MGRLLDRLVSAAVYLVQVSRRVQDFIVRSLVVEKHLVLGLVEREAKAGRFGQRFIER